MTSYSKQSDDRTDLVAVHRLALSATLHCLAGCSIGEVLGMAAGAVFGWSNVATVVVSIVLAFVFGYTLTIRPLRRSGLPLGRAVRLALASDTLSITIMEIVDNVFVLAVPGAMNARITDSLFWSSLAVSLLVAGVAAYPANRWLVVRGRGHALVHAHHVSSGDVHDH